MDQAVAEPNRPLLKLELQRSMLHIVEGEARARLHPGAPRSPAPADTGLGHAFSAHVASLDDPGLEALRLRVATALLHEVDRLLAEGHLVATNSELA